MRPLVLLFAHSNVLYQLIMESERRDPSESGVQNPQETLRDVWDKP